MVSIALHTVLTEGREHEYEEVHRSVPPELAATLREHGVADWRIWRDGRDVFHLVEVPDVETFNAMRCSLANDPVNLAWQATVAPFFDTPDDYSGDDREVPMIWSLVGQIGDLEGESVNGSH